MNLAEIQELIKFVSKSGVTEVEIEKKDFKIVIKSDSKRKPETALPQVIHATLPAAPAPAPVAIQAPAPAAAPAPASAPPADASSSTDNSRFITIKSPMIGTFYRSASPDKPPFMNVGDDVKPGKVICIIEAMKLFNEIESEVSGKIVKVLVDDASPVEYDQPLFLVDPA